MGQLNIYINDTDMTQYLKDRSLNIKDDSSHFKSCNLILHNLTIADGVPEEGKRLDVKYTKDDETIINVFSGVIDSKDIDLLTPAGDKLSVNVSSNGYRTVPYRRTVTETFDIPDNAPTDDEGQYITAAYIIGYLINQYLAVEGITFPNIIEFEGKRYYEEMQFTCMRVGDIIDQMARDSFGSWYIDINRNLHFVEEYAAQQGVDTADLDVSAYGGILVDFRNPRLKTSIENYANKIFFRGDLDDNLDEIQVFAQDDDQIAYMKAVTGGSGVYGDTVENSNIKTIAEAQEYCKKILAKRISKPKTLEFDTFDWLNFSVGNIQNVHIPQLGITNTETRPPNYIVESITLSDFGGNKLSKKISMRQLFPTGRDGAYTWSKSNQGAAFFRALVNEAKKTPDRLKDLAKNKIYFENLRGGTLSTQNMNGDGDYIQLERQFMTFWDNDAPAAPKMALGFIEGLSSSTPGIVLGAGDGDGNYRAYIQKDTNGFELIYKWGTGASDVSGIKFDNDGNILINDSIVPPLTDIVLQGEYSSAAEMWNAKLQGMKYDGTDDVYYYGDKVIKPLNDDNFLMMGGTYCDMQLWDRGFSTSYPWFAIRQEDLNANVGSFALYGASGSDYQFLDFGVQSGYAYAHPVGDWDFSNAHSVTGLSVTAKFA